MTTAAPAGRLGIDTAMIRLFKHYIPNTVLLLGLFDFAVLLLAGELG